LPSLSLLPSHRKYITVPYFCKRIPYLACNNIWRRVQAAKLLIMQVSPNFTLCMFSWDQNSWYRSVIWLPRKHSCWSKLTTDIANTVNSNWGHLIKPFSAFTLEKHGSS
jgi:hypothetical protein